MSVTESTGQLPVQYKAKHLLGHDCVGISVEPL